MRLYSMNKAVARRQAAEHFRDKEKEKENDRLYSQERYKRLKADPEAMQKRRECMREYNRQRYLKNKLKANNEQQ